MTDITPLIAKLRTEEGCKLNVYDDATGQAIGPSTYVKGNPTIGIGTNLGVGAGITEEEADYLLSNRLNIAASEVATLAGFNLLDDVRKLVLIDMCFNMGLPTLQTFTVFLGYVASGQYNAAADDMLQTKWAKEVGQRAVNLAQVMRTGAWS